MPGVVTGGITVVVAFGTVTVGTVTGAGAVGTVSGAVPTTVVVTTGRGAGLSVSRILPITTAPVIRTAMTSAAPNGFGSRFFAFRRNSRQLRPAITSGIGKGMTVLSASR